MSTHHPCVDSFRAFILITQDFVRASNQKRSLLSIAMLAFNKCSLFPVVLLYIFIMLFVLWWWFICNFMFFYTYFCTCIKNIYLLFCYLRNSSIFSSNFNSVIFFAFAAILKETKNAHVDKNVHISIICFVLGYEVLEFNILPFSLSTKRTLIEQLSL